MIKMDSNKRSYFDEILNIKHEPEETIIDVDESHEEKSSLVLENPRTLSSRKYNSSFKSYSCDLCGKSFSSKRSIKYHIRYHLCNEIGEHCGKCNKYTKNISFHDQTVHCGPSFSCDVCDFSTKYIANLHSHTKKHFVKKQFNCSFCDKTFSDQSNKNRHIREKHTKVAITKVTCPICPKPVTFTRSDNLDLHLKRIHGFHRGDYQLLVMKEGLYQCDICATPFLYKTSIRSHMSTHHINLKTTYKCHLCSKEFKTKEALRYHHQSLHLKKFNCKFCRKSLGSGKTLRTHEARGNCQT